LHFSSAFVKTDPQTPALFKLENKDESTSSQRLHHTPGAQHQTSWALHSVLGSRDVSYFGVLPHPVIVTDVTTAQRTPRCTQGTAHSDFTSGLSVLLRGQQKGSHWLLGELVSPFPHLGIYHPVSVSVLNTLILRTVFLSSPAQQSRDPRCTAQRCMAESPEHPGPAKVPRLWSPCEVTG